MSDKTTLLTTALHALHREHGGRLVPFAGWELPIQYEGVVTEHRWCRAEASLFDVSHMSIFEIEATPTALSAVERLTPTSITALKPGQSRYGVFTTYEGGVLDDFIATRLETTLQIVSNASRRTTVAEALRIVLKSCPYNEVVDVSLLALQGPKAAEVLNRINPSVTELGFMSATKAELIGTNALVGRSGYTGEDGFEIMVANTNAESLARTLLDNPEVKLAGLGARDSLRLEAGLCLYGNDLDETTTPVEAGLGWTIGKKRNKEGNFPGAQIIADQLENGVQRLRVGIRPEGRRPVRDGAPLSDVEGTQVGTVTSGGYGPTLDTPVAMAYVNKKAAEPNTTLIADVRGRQIKCSVTDLPFAPHNYHKG